MMKNPSSGISSKDLTNFERVKGVSRAVSKRSKNERYGEVFKV